MLDILLSSKVCIEKILWIGKGKTTFNFHGIFHTDAGKNDSASKPRRLSAFSVYIFREHYSFWSTGHVRFKFQLTDVENECY